MGKVNVQGIGEVILNRQSVRDSLAHGIGRNKAIAFKAVPNVLTQGEIIDRQKNWKNRGYDSYTIAAPITIKGERYIAVAIVNEAKEQNNHRFYLHEVGLQKSLLSEEFKTGMDTRSPQGDIISVLQKLAQRKGSDFVWGDTGRVKFSVKQPKPLTAEQQAEIEEALGFVLAFWRSEILLADDAISANCEINRNQCLYVAAQCRHCFGWRQLKP